MAAIVDPARVVAFDYAKFNPSGRELAEDSQDAIDAFFVAHMVGVVPQDGGGLAVWHGAGLRGHAHAIEHLRRHVAPHMSGKGFMDFLKSGAAKGALKSTLSGALTSGIQSFTSGEGSIKQRLLGALKSAAAGAGQAALGNAGGLLQAGIANSTTAQRVLGALGV